MPLPKIPTGIENQANAAFEEVKASVDAYQTTYFATNGRYWQGLMSSDIPTNGQNKAMKLNRKPTDQTEDWSWFSPSGSYPISFDVIPHQSIGGHSYSVRGWVEIAGKRYLRVNNGPWEEALSSLN